jgi:hypothetical protein
MLFAYSEQNRQKFCAKFFSKVLGVPRTFFQKGSWPPEAPHGALATPL